ncbi:MAG TPA: polymer-forming cytoskeletal protein [Steroidobacteraceae bacterium]|nr:polymer-forming cytoskeletal protein [Steroidobacteraceae bacterium]
MFKRREKNSAARIDTLIGRSASVQGDVEFAGGLHLDGRITGSVCATAGAAASLSVSEHGVVEGSVRAPHVVLNGRVNGDIFGSERVVLGAKARVRGNVHYGVIEMALGAEISGKLVPRNHKESPAGHGASALPGEPQDSITPPEPPG